MRTPDRRELNHRTRFALTGLIASVALAAALSGCSTVDSASSAASDYLGEKADDARAQACYAQQKVISGGLQQYNAMMDSSPVSIDDLVSENILPSIPECPSGGAYTYDLDNGTVMCSEHGSAE